MEQDDEIRALRNAYAKEWRKNNPEKVKATNERFYRRLKVKNEQKLNNND